MLIARQTPGHLAENVMHFARVLRAAGLPVGTDRVQLALQALQVAGFESKRDFHAVLAACLLDRIEHRELFDQAFVLFWRDPDLLGRMRALLLPKVQVKDGMPPAPENRRLADALFPHQPPTPPEDEPQQQIELDAALTWNDRELLQKADFDTMTADEWLQARRLLADLPLMFEQLPTRRTRPAAPPGRPDWRTTLQAMARHGGELWDMRWRRARTRPAPLTVLADISGSMSRYSRMLLHFAHALGHAEARVESFVFGTRLTRTTRLLKSRDPDLAISQVVRAVEDWSGGTRITTSLQEFNRRWARRVLNSRATVLLISDGLEHGDTQPLAFEMERLRKSCRRLIWLNPLLRFERFEPRAGGIKAMLPHVDRFLPAHNLQSLAELVQVLRQMDTAPRRLH
ncbi:vWA domain-containing protein [Aquabacterium humicola]|uniref:vWA domain-containing protein n=1 Tax=Aquabacterium humicola TaxID=3237377 RepID=UPI0025438C6F|nr:VWA domain-containing protein [Rubrivivax pictus]